MIGDRSSRPVVDWEQREIGAAEASLKPHQPTPKPLVRTPMHPARPFREWRRKTGLAIEEETQLARLKMSPTLSALALARIKRIPNASTAKITA